MGLRRGIGKQKQSKPRPLAQPFLIGCRGLGGAPGCVPIGCLAANSGAKGRGLTWQNLGRRCPPALVVEEARYPPLGPGRWCWVVAR